MNFKFVWNGIKVDKKLYRAWYSDGKLKNYPVGTITIYAKEYYRPPMPIIEGLTVHNDSDSMSDYFEHDRIRAEPTNITRMFWRLKNYKKYTTKKGMIKNMGKSQPL